MQGRTAILVSHHVQLCAPGANYIVALDNGRVQFEGDYTKFQGSGVIRSLVQSTLDDKADETEDKVIESKLDNAEDRSESTTLNSPPSEIKAKKAARKLVEEEARAIGRVRKDVWAAYFSACGRYWYWILFGVTFFVSALAPVAENGWLR